VIAEELGTYSATLRYEHLPVAVRQKIKLHLLDTLGSAMLAAEMAKHQTLLDVYTEQGEHVVWGTHAKRSLRDAIVLNSFLSHATYLDDGDRHSGAHPGCVIVPAVLALAVGRKLSGSQAIAAIAAGYEVMLRVGGAIYPSAVIRGFQSTAILGALGSAAASASMLGLSSVETANAIAIASNLGVGLKGALQEASSQPLQVARASEGGVVAAFYAAAGAKGWNGIIENGFLGAFSDEYDESRVLLDLGGAHRVMDSYAKLHGGCRGCHAAIDVVELAVKKSDISVKDIEAMTVVVDEVAYAAENHNPTSGEEGQFSIPFAVALMLIKGSAAAPLFNDENIEDQEVRSLMRRIKVVGDSSRIEDFPHKKGALVEIEMKNGELVHERILAAKGEPEFPMNQADMERKFLSLARGTLGSSAELLMGMVLNMEKYENLDFLSASLSRSLEG